MLDLAERVKIAETSLLSNDWYLLKKITFDYLRNDGSWQRQSREVYDRGDGAVILLFDPQHHTVVLTRQFRMPVFVNGYRQLLIEAAAGLLDGAAPEARIRAEAEEETGYRIGAVRKVFEAFMSPGSVTEKLHFFLADYDARSKVGPGGGLEAETEDLEVLEMPLEQALAAIGSGQIVDAKTIMLLQYLALEQRR
ncbi:MAG: NUDIX domain-containing protein [Pseudomonas sp.]|uniref:NUDIX domain-containing protein n=1 Tax=Pseudomonas sp. TaxID=306 RepID=UPI003396F784